MNLIADIGNTSIKLALYENGIKLSGSRYDELTKEDVDKVLTGFRIDRAIISAVRTVPDFLLGKMNETVPFVHLLSYKSSFPFSSEYETPETLGPDRLAGISGAFMHFPGSDLLVIDAGTALTYDFMTGGIYRGGNIAPGLHSRFRSLHDYTGKLPLVRPENKYTSPGRNTRDAILAGVILGTLYEINEYIRTFEKNSSDLKIILTGGDSGFLKDKIDHPLTYMPDIVMDGLNYILEYNAV
jgi:type III pantothenate kinase